MPEEMGTAGIDWWIIKDKHCFEIALTRVWEHNPFFRIEQKQVNENVTQ